MLKHKHQFIYLFIEHFQFRFGYSIETICFFWHSLDILARSNENETFYEFQIELTFPCAW